MRRPSFIAVLCLLLLSLQHQGYVHPLTHLGEPSKHTIVTTAHADATCLECALLAGGFDAAHASLISLAADAPPADRIFHSYHSRAGEVPAWFQSRAPPVLL